MARFRVRALSPNGQVANETVHASSVAEAAGIVESQGRVVQSIEAGDVVRSYEPVHPAPPSAPRPVPSGVKGAAGGAVLMIVGGFFMAIASIFIAVGVGALLNGDGEGLFFALFPLIHFTVGASLVGYAIRTRSKRRRIYRSGIATVAVVDRVGLNRNVRVNGRSPYEIGWTFYLGDQAWHGKRSSMNEALTTMLEGDRIWVLYDPDDPGDSVEWPPS